eukprot:gene40835-49804_t
MEAKTNANSGFMISNDVSDPSWTFVYRKDNIFVSQRKEKQSDFLAFRGEMVSKVAISQILGAFFNASHTLKWADKLATIEVLPVATVDTQQTKPSKGFSLPKLFGKKPPVEAMQSSHILALQQLQAGKSKAEDVVYQVYKMWPLPPRDFVFNRTVLIENSVERVNILYTTMEDARKPKQKGWVRTEAPYTIWTFQSYKSFCLSNVLQTPKNNKKHKHSSSPPTTSNQRESLCTQTSSEGLTYISLQSFVLMDDIQVPWLINYVQRSWPYNTLKMFVEHVQDLGVERVGKNVIEWE